MLNGRMVVAAALALALILGLGAVGSAQSRVAVMDLAFVIDESRAGKEGNMILQAAVAERQAQVSAMEDRLLELETSLADNTLTDAERAERLASLEAAALEYSETVARFQSELEQLVQSLRGQIVSDVSVVVQMIAQEREIDLILDVNQAYYYREAIDVTLDVIQRYDELFDAARDAGE